MTSETIWLIAVVAWLASGAIVFFAIMWKRGASGLRPMSDPGLGAFLVLLGPVAFIAVALGLIGEVIARIGKASAERKRGKS